MAKRKKKPARKRKPEPQWKTVEKVVALLEKSLAPEARVSHDVKLPSLTTGHLLQCDVVIEMGNEPRITRTIVEVQKRNQQVKPNDFRGWCKKMEDVGANRLICVSAKNFPASVKDAVAKELGPRVLLVKLAALEANEWPFQMVNNVIKVYKSSASVDSSHRPNPQLVFHPDESPFKEFFGELFESRDLPDVIKRDGREELSPIMDLINEGIGLLNEDPNLLRVPEGKTLVPVRWKPVNTSLCFKGRTAPILEVRAVFELDTRCFLFPFEVSSYTQEGHNPLAWIVRAIGQIEGEDAEIRFACVPNADGSFTISRPQFLGVKEGGYLLLGFRKGEARPQSK